MSYDGIIKKYEEVLKKLGVTEPSMNISVILKNSKTIAVVGLSDKPERPSYDVATYLLEHGYNILPVNPNLVAWKGIKSYKSLSEIPKPECDKIDIVGIFRKSEDVLPVVEEAIKLGTKTIWMQLGIVNEEAAEKARKAGLNVIINKCMKIEHANLS